MIGGYSYPVFFPPLSYHTGQSHTEACGFLCPILLPLDLSQVSPPTNILHFEIHLGICFSGISQHTLPCSRNQKKKKCNIELLIMVVSISFLWMLMIRLRNFTSRIAKSFLFNHESMLNLSKNLPTPVEGIMQIFFSPLLS